MPLKIVFSRRYPNTLQPDNLLWLLRACQNR